MNQVEKERCAKVNHALVLNQEAFDAAWTSFQNTKIDLLADSDDEQCRCVWNAIHTYMEGIRRTTVLSDAIGRQYTVPASASHGPC